MRPFSILLQAPAFGGSFSMLEDCANSFARQKKVRETWDLTTWPPLSTSPLHLSMSSCSSYSVPDPAHCLNHMILCFHVYDDDDTSNNGDAVSPSDSCLSGATVTNILRFRERGVAAPHVNSMEDNAIIGTTQGTAFYANASSTNQLKRKREDSEEGLRLLADHKCYIEL